MSTRQTNQTKIDQLIADEFGVNADYVLELLQQFEREPGSIDEEWRTFFVDLLSNGNVASDVQGQSTKPSPELTQSGLTQSGAPREQSAASKSGVTQSTYDWGREATPVAPATKPAQDAAPAISPD